MPEALVRGFSPATFATRSSLGPLRAGAETLLSTARWHPVASCYSVSHRRGETTRLLALGRSSADEAAVHAAWERLVERTCLRAAGDGKLRVLARPEEGSEPAHVLARLGFTSVTGEQIWGRGCSPGAGERTSHYQPLRSNDAWDAWKLYNRTEPSTVQRAEGLTPASWWKGRRLRRGPYQEWILREAGDLVIHLELVFGRHAAALSLHYDPEYRDALPSALGHALAVCSQRQIDAIYCTVRDHQAELNGLLAYSGFEPVRSQTRLVLYTSVLSYATEASALPAVEKVTPVLRTGLTRFSRGRDDESDPLADWYNRGQ